MTMAIKRQYAILDHKAQNFLNPFTCVNDGDAIRLFTTWVNNTEEPTNISKYPADFSLFFMGVYDDLKGTYNQEGENQRKELILGVSVQNEAQKKFTIEELLTMLDQYQSRKNVTELPSSLKTQAE
jgi:hypothetical protein